MLVSSETRPTKVTLSGGQTSMARRFEGDASYEGRPTATLPAVSLGRLLAAVPGARASEGVVHILIRGDPGCCRSDALEDLRQLLFRTPSAGRQLLQLTGPRTYFPVVGTRRSPGIRSLS